MDNRIRSIRLRDSRLDPAESEVIVTVIPEQLTSTTQVRGRLMGPRCRYASTVEVAYRLTEWLRQYEKEGEPQLVHRVIIPEASFWEPETPFLYEGPVELWQKGQRCDQVQLSHGLRKFNLGPRGLRCNGRLLTLHGAQCSPRTEEDALRLHQAGCNTLLVPVTDDIAPLWERADRLGFLMLGRIANRKGYAPARALWGHASCLGWVLDSAMLQDPLVSAGHLYPADAMDGQLVGIRLEGKPPQALPEGIHFVMCDEDLLPILREISLPKLIVTGKGFPENEPVKEVPDSADVLGWIYA